MAIQAGAAAGQAAMNGLIVSMAFRRQAEQVAGVQEPVGVSSEAATLQVTSVLAPVTLESHTAGIKSLALPVPAAIAAAQPAPLLASGYYTTKTIVYTYDPLYRLTLADYYNDDTYFRYTYDAVGNRLTEETRAVTTNYTYDIANRLTSVNGQNYEWDDNGNLRDDGPNTYTYNYVNQLVAVSGPSLSSSYAYNGQGDRLSQTAGITTTNYTLDIAAGLTQVLDDGTNAYLYGLGRIGDQQPGGWRYHLGDALGSVRQMVDASGAVSLAQNYEPYGDTLSSQGEGSSAFQFTGEMRDATGLTYLRARYLDSRIGRFTTHDRWDGDSYRPTTYHAWLYGFNDPVRYIDPSGLTSILPLAYFTRGPDYSGKWNPDGTDTNGGKRDNDGISTYVAPEWQSKEKLTIYRALSDIAEAYANAYNQELLRRYREDCGPDLGLLPYPKKISPYIAFLKVHGGSITFQRRAENATQFFSQAARALTPSGAWAQAQSSQEIYIFNNATASDVADNNRFIVHEMGHAFESAIGGYRARAALVTEHPIMYQ